MRALFLLLSIVAASVLAKDASQEDSLLVSSISCKNSAEEVLLHKVQALLPYSTLQPTVSKQTEELLQVAKQAADKGDGRSMQIYGSLVLMRYLADDSRYSKDSTEQIKDALTYLYISELAEDDNVDFTKEMIEEIDKNRLDNKLSIAWINQAKANATAWKAICKIE